MSSVRVKFYGRNGNYRWTAWSPNNRIIGSSTEAYLKKNACKHNFELLTGRNADTGRLLWEPTPQALTAAGVSDEDAPRGWSVTKEWS